MDANTIDAWPSARPGCAFGEGRNLRFEFARRLRIAQDVRSEIARPALPASSSLNDPM